MENVGQHSDDRFAAEETVEYHYTANSGAEYVVESLDQIPAECPIKGLPLEAQKMFMKLAARGVQKLEAKNEEVAKETTQEVLKTNAERPESDQGHKKIVESQKVTAKAPYEQVSQQRTEPEPVLARVPEVVVKQEDAVRQIAERPDMPEAAATNIEPATDKTEKRLETSDTQVIAQQAQAVATAAEASRQALDEVVSEALGPDLVPVPEVAAKERPVVQAKQQPSEVFETAQELVAAEEIVSTVEVQSELVPMELPEVPEFAEATAEVPVMELDLAASYESDDPFDVWLRENIMPPSSEVVLEIADEMAAIESIGGEALFVPEIAPIDAVSDTEAVQTTFEQEMAMEAVSTVEEVAPEVLEELEALATHPRIAEVFDTGYWRRVLLAPPKRTPIKLPIGNAEPSRPDDLSIAREYIWMPSVPDWSAIGYNVSQRLGVLLMYLLARLPETRLQQIA